MKICVYPGSFDPVTNGHLDIILRAAGLFDKLIVAIGNNQSKKTVFTVEERKKLLECSLSEHPEIEVDCFSGLLTDYVIKKNASTIIKGLRTISDYEYELQMATLNKSLAPQVETLFLVADMKHSFISSSIVREIARFGGRIDELVPECILQDIIDKFKCRKE